MASQGSRGCLCSSFAHSSLGLSPGPSVCPALRDTHTEVNGAWLCSKVYLGKSGDGGGGLLSRGVRCGEPACGSLSGSGLGCLATLPLGDNCGPGQGGWCWVVWGLVGKCALTSGPDAGTPCRKGSQQQTPSRTRCSELLEPRPPRQLVSLFSLLKAFLKGSPGAFAVPGQSDREPRVAATHQQPS